VDEATAERLRSYDVVVHNIGNHYGYHRDIFEISRCVPGVVVLHDEALGDLFLHLYGDGSSNVCFLSRVEELYGPQERLVAQRLFGAPSGRWAQTEDSLTLPFSEEALTGQTGVVTHSRAHAEDVSARWPGRVCQLPFPTYPEWFKVAQPSGKSRDRVTFVTSGMVNRNTHIDDVITVLRRNRGLAARVCYRVVGRPGPSHPYVRELAAMVARAALADTVKLLGPQPTLAFARLTSEADVHVNLRCPALEGGSACAAEQLASGRPLVVADTGSYAELPADAALKVPPGDLDALEDALLILATSPERRAAIGAAGRCEAQKRSLDSYCRELFGFLASAQSDPAQPFIDRVHAELQNLGMSPELAVHGRIGRSLTAILPRWTARADPRLRS
jgi:glycosyltransferase involved in cell wall biosynthesis